MDLQNNDKLQTTLFAANRHGILTSSFLDKMGVSRQLRYQYRKSGWLQSVGFGAYVLPDTKISWQMVASALQKQLNINVHVGGKTVFALKGLTHYLKSDRIYFFYTPGTRIPKWALGLKVLQNTELVFIKCAFLGEEKLSLTEHEGVKISSLERAILEQLFLVGKYESFDETYKLVETLTSLRAKHLQTLLETCTSVRVKRVFLYLAETLNYPWSRKLDISRIDLGSGVRKLVEDGEYIAKYMIYLPPRESE